MDPVKGYYISGNDKKTLTNYNLEYCKYECEHAQEFKCISFDFRPAYRTCYLQEVNRNGAILTVSASYEYYEINFEGKFI